MYLVLKGSATELQGMLEGKLPVEAAKFVDGEEVPALYKIDSVETYGGLVRHSDDVYGQAVVATVSDWEGGSSGSGSGSEA